MELGIAGRRVLVVGASRGIGRAIALGFARERCRVTGIARDERALQSLLAELGGEPAGHAYCVADLMVEHAPKETAARLLAQQGPLDIVVHNVGGPLGFGDPLSPLADWHRVWHFNAGIAIAMNEVLVPPMIERRWGRVIHVSSRSADTLRGRAAYACAKAYVNAYATTLGRALAKTGVVVSALMPGAVAFEDSYWDVRRKEHPEQYEDFLRHHQAIGRMGTPEEIAHFAVFMGSELVTFAQGAVVPIDGGHM